MKCTNKIVFELIIGSWGSYNADNERAGGSKWLDLDDFDSWEEIEEELKKEGFKLDGIDKDLFVQDYDSDLDIHDCDHLNPKKMFNVIKKSGILDYKDAYKKALAYVEAYGFESFCEKVEKDGEYWADDYDLFDGDVYDYGYELAHSQKIPECLEGFINYERYGQDDILSGNATETSYGILRG